MRVLIIIDLIKALENKLIKAFIEEVEVLIITKALENRLVKALIEEVEVLIITKLANISRGVKSAKDNDNLKL